MSSYIGVYNVPDGCLHEYDIRDWIASGNYSTLYETCRKTNCQLIAKVVLLRPPGNDQLVENIQVVLPPDNYVQTREVVSADDFEREAKLTVAAAAQGVAPRVHDWWICKEGVKINGDATKLWMGVLVMDRVNASLREWVETNPARYNQEQKQLRTIAAAQLDKLHKLGIAHNDVHADNIGLNIVSLKQPPSQVISLYLIDYGQAAYPATQGAMELDNKSLKKAFDRLDLEALSLLKYQKHELKG